MGLARAQTCATPENVPRVARIIVEETGSCARARAVAGLTLELLREGADSRGLILDDREKHWLDMLHIQLETIPSHEEDALAAAGVAGNEDVMLAEYGLG